MAHLEALPAWQLKEDLDALQRCVYVFNTNAKELAAHVGRFLSSSQFSRDLPESYVNELVRLLHNYLTSVTSLIDSQRVVMRHRWPDGDGASEFEANDYSAKLAEAFETGEAVFMSKLRNYCTHYSIPLPTLGTTFAWEQGSPVVQTNTLQLEREKLMRWGGWTGPGRRYLEQQAEHFDLAPIIERYVNAAGQFAGWFWAEINTRSAELIEEITTKAAELKLWHDEQVGPPDWIEQGQNEAPLGWNGRLWKAGLRRDRYKHGTRGFRVWQASTEGVVGLIKDDDWTPLPSRYHSPPG